MLKELFPNVLWEQVWQATVDTITMTGYSVLATFIFGTIPLVISSGAGAASRHSVGTGVMGGMIAATFMAVFFVPLFYRLIEEMSKRGDDEKK